MPFPRDKGTVTRVLKSVSQRGCKGIARGPVAGKSNISNHVAQSNPVGLGPGEQARTRRHASRICLELRQGQTGPGKAVDLRRCDLGAIPTEVAKPKIVRHNHNDIRPLSKARSTYRVGRQQDANDGPKQWRS